MSTVDFSTLNTLESFKAFLQQYHANLNQTRSFPPLGLQKALHSAAPVFGFNDWHVMSAALAAADSAQPAVAPQARELTDKQLDALALQYRIEFTDLDDEWGWRSLSETIESPHGWPTKKEAWDSACEYYDIEVPAYVIASLPMPDESLDELAKHYGFRFNELEGGLIDWSTLDGDIESEQAWKTKGEAWADLCETMGLDSRFLVDLTAARSSQPAAPVAAEPERVHVVTVTVTTLQTDHQTIDSVETKVLRSWEAAKEHVADRVRAKVTYNDRSMEEVLEDCRSITKPDEDEADGMDENEILEWLIDHNDIDGLISLLSYLDYDLTTVTTDEDWI